MLRYSVVRGKKLSNHALSTQAKAHPFHFMRSTRLPEKRIESKEQDQTCFSHNQSMIKMAKRTGIEMPSSSDIGDQISGAK
jgi:hypothetical protein